MTYTHQLLAMNIEDHPLGKTLPKATEDSSIHAGPPVFRDFAARGDAPTALKDFIYSDTPQLSLHITSFNDATLVALSWPHTLMDVMGQQALLHSWSLVLAGRESEVPPVLGAQEDAICAAVNVPVEEKEEEFKLGNKQLKGWQMLKFGLRFGLDLLWNQVVETRTLFLPKRLVTELRRQAQEDLAVLGGEEEELFVSEGDVLTAWVTRAIVSSLPQPRPATVLHALNARFRLPSLVQAPGVYIQNMAIAAFAFLSQEVAAGSLGVMALANRRDLKEQSTEGQVLAFLRYLQEKPKVESDPSMVCGETDAVLVPCTNWTRARIFQTADFSAAVVRAGEIQSARSNPPGSIVFHHAQSLRSSAAVRNVIVLLGKDHGNNHWLTGILLPSAWARLEEDIKQMEQHR